MNRRRLPSVMTVDGVTVDVAQIVDGTICPQPMPPGWGDRFAAWLASSHWWLRGGRITPETYRRFWVRWGFIEDLPGTGCCACEARKEKLNAFGRRVAKWRKRLN